MNRTLAKIIGYLLMPILPGYLLWIIDPGVAELKALLNLALLLGALFSPVAAAYFIHYGKRKTLRTEND